MLANQPSLAIVTKMKFRKKNSSYLCIDSLFLDCCTEMQVGTSEFKGVYHYSATLIHKQVNQMCAYQTNKTFTRKCVANLMKGPSWEEQGDVIPCPVKRETTRDLIKLAVVSTIPQPENDVRTTLYGR